MRKLIEKINQKDYATRRRLLISLCAITGVFVLAVWVVTVQHMKTGRSEQPAVTPQQDGTASSFDSISKKIKETWDAMKQDIGSTIIEIEKAASSTPASTDPARTTESTSTQQ